MRCDDILEHPKRMIMKKMIRNYTDLIKLKTFEERFDYLKLDGIAGVSTFGFDRYLNQYFYTSYKWRQVRRDVIARDNACDLGIEERSIFGNIRVHHMNPITVEDLELEKDAALNPEFLICVSLRTHNAIHFGDKDNLFDLPKERRKGDTNLWAKIF